MTADDPRPAGEAAKMAVRTVVDKDGQPTGEVSYWMWCPACDDAVRINNTWGWNGDLERPTFTPSILTRFTMQGRDRVCHSFLTDGVWNFLGDCTHAMAGQSVPMVALPDWLQDGAR